MREKAMQKAGAGWSASAPAVIGPIVSTIDLGEGTVSYALQLRRSAFLVFLSAIFGVALSIPPAALLVWVLRHYLGVDLETARFVAKGLAAVVSLGTAALAAPLAWEVNAPASRAFIGREGVARFDRRSDRAARAPSLLLRFADVRHLVEHGRVELERKGTDASRIHFDYQWVGASGATLLRLRGFYEQNEDGVPSWVGNPKEKALADEIEKAWNDFLLRRARATVESGEVVEFVRDAGRRERRARIGRGFVELIDGERIERWEAEDIDELELSLGTVTIRRRDPLRGRDVEHRYPGGIMENASFFRIALREIAGVRVRGWCG